MKLIRRSEEPAEVAEEEPTAEPAVGKGRPTPKRRDTVGRRGPVTPPRTRKEAYARQRQLAKTTRSAARTPASQMTVAQRRAALKAGDPAVLPRRDQGATKKLARDYVDSHRMISNYLLVIFPLMILSYVVSYLQLVVLAAFVGIVCEWFVVGRRIRVLAVERTGSADGGAMSIGLYAGTRAYLPRRWRLPAPQVSIGDEI